MKLRCRGCGGERHQIGTETVWCYECKGATVMGSLNEFHKQNVARQHEAFAPPHPITALVVCVQEEVGELAGAVLGVTGEKKRKAHKTHEDVLDAVADAMTYLSLVAAAAGCDDLEKLLGDTFNMVSDRAGSKIRTQLGQGATEEGKADWTAVEAACRAEPRGSPKNCPTCGNLYGHDCPDAWHDG